MVNNSELVVIPALGDQLRAARKKLFPNDDMSAFSVRLGVSRSTLQKMEKGDLSVSMGRYFEAAKLMRMESRFTALFKQEESLFGDD